MAAGIQDYYLYIKSNDGTQTLYSEKASGGSPWTTYYDTEDMPRGLYDDNFPPEDNLLFDLTGYDGLATTVGAVSPDIASGTHFVHLTSDVTVYVVGSGGASL